LSVVDPNPGWRDRVTRCAGSHASLGMPDVPAGTRFVPLIFMKREHGCQATRVTRSGTGRQREESVMSRRKGALTGLVVGQLLAAVHASAWRLIRCPPDSVKVGNVCVDRYEESVWQIPLENTLLLRLIRAGKATLADLTAGGATQLSPSPSCSPGYPANFPQSGQWTPVLGSNP